MRSSPPPPDRDQRSARQALRRLASPATAALLRTFFKTGPGEYGEGDIFIGVKVPQIRAIARQHHALPRRDVLGLLRSPVHEDRLLALIILAHQFNAQVNDRPHIVRLYLDHTRHINNWDLVDISAPGIIGAWLLDKDRGLLDGLAGSTLMWDRRIAIVATLAFIRQGQCADTFRLCRRLMDDGEDLLHKACGWMLREAGKRDVDALRAFLRDHAARLPRTMLRYAIERFPEGERRAWLTHRPTP